MIRTILERKSVRSFTTALVKQQELELLLKAGMAAPSAVNKQPWAFIAITDRILLDTLGKKLPYAKMLLKATAAILVCGDLQKTLPGWEQEFWIQDCSAATENILLAAESIQLGAVWTAIYPATDRLQIIKEQFDLPEHILPLNVIAIGHPTDSEKAKEKWNPDNIHWNQW